MQAAADTRRECWKCRAERGAALVCSRCAAIQPLSPDADLFTVLDLPRQVEDGEEISVRGEGLDGRATRAHERRAALRAALPAFPPCVRCRLHRSRVPSPDPTTNEERSEERRFTFGLRRLKPEAISSSL